MQILLRRLRRAIRNCELRHTATPCTIGRNCQNQLQSSIGSIPGSIALFVKLVEALSFGRLAARDVNLMYVVRKPTCLPDPPRAGEAGTFMTCING